MAITFKIEEYEALKKRMDKLQKAPDTIMKRTLSDMKSRAPGWVATEVAKVYGVKKGEITSGALGSVSVQGDSVKDVTIKYRGRVLTPTHFGMTPKAPGKNAYTLKASILRGQKSTLGKVKKLTKKQRQALGKNFTRSGERTSDHSPIMLMPTGSTYIPFQRKSVNRKDVEAIKTLSMPQMVSSDRTQPNISNAIGENLQKRLDHHMQLLFK